MCLWQTEQKRWAGRRDGGEREIEILSSLPSSLRSDPCLSHLTHIKSPVIVATVVTLTPGAPALSSLHLWACQSHTEREREKRERERETETEREREREREREALCAKGHEGAIERTMDNGLLICLFATFISFFILKFVISFVLLIVCKAYNERRQRKIVFCLFICFCFYLFCLLCFLFLFVQLIRFIPFLFFCFVHWFSFLFSVICLLVCVFVESCIKEGYIEDKRKIKFVLFITFYLFLLICFSLSLFVPYVYFVP